MSELIDRKALLAKIDERIKLEELDTATKYGNETPEQVNNSYSTWLKYEIADFVDDIRDEIVNAPTVVERPKGKWEYTTHYGRRYRICPNCHAEREDDKTKWNFCPNCGADMRGDV